MKIDQYKLGVMEEAGKVVLKEVPLDKVGPNDLLLKMEANNICTSDYQTWNGSRKGHFPYADGHEWCGIVIEKGSKVSERYFSIGDRVGLGNGSGCGICHECRNGKPEECFNLEFAFSKDMPIDGYVGRHGMGQYRVISMFEAVKISNSIPAAHAGMLEPVATVVRGLKRICVSAGEDVAIIGAGTMGILNAQVAHAFGANVIITEISQKKLERARSMGFATVIDAGVSNPVEQVKKATDRMGAEKVIVAVGNTLAYRQAFDMLCPIDGSVLFFAANYPEPEMDLKPNALHYRKMHLVGTVGAGMGDFTLASKLMSKGIVDPGYAMENKEFPLSKINDAFAAACEPDSYRVTIRLDQD